jgi:hypothetical protein
MAQGFWTRVRAIASASALIALLVAPASADAKRKFATPPAGDDIAVVGGAPAVAYAAPDGVHVSHPTKSGHRWQQLGGTIRHTAGAPVYDVDIAVHPDGRPWVAWTEDDASGARQARVARFDGRRWREVVGGDHPLNEVFDPGYPPFGAYDPKIVFAGGRVWVGYVQASVVDDVMGFRRLASDGSHWEHLKGDFLVRPDETRVAAVGGRPYVGVTDVLAPGAFVYRYDSAPDFFDLLPYVAGYDYTLLDDISSVGGRVTLMFTRAYSVPDAPVEVWTLAAGDVWQRLGAPLTTAGNGQDLEGRYAAWIEDGTVRTAYLGGDGVWRAIRLSGNATATFARLASGPGGTWLLWRDAAGVAQVTRLSGA